MSRSVSAPIRQGVLAALCAAALHLDRFRSTCAVSIIGLRTAAFRQVANPGQQETGPRCQLFDSTYPALTPPGFEAVRPLEGRAEE